MNSRSVRTSVNLVATRYRLRIIHVLTTLALCSPMSAEHNALKADIDSAIVGTTVVSKIVLGGKAKPHGRLATYSVSTLFYPDTNRVVYRTDSAIGPTDVEPTELRQQFDKGTSFRVRRVDLKEDRVVLKLETMTGNASLDLVLGTGWQSNVDLAFVQKQLGLVLDLQPERHGGEATATASTALGQQVQEDPTSAPDAVALEAQYKTCAKHYIPSDKCTPEIYHQLKEKDDAPLDPLTASALRAIEYYRTRLKNPESLQVHTAYITKKGDVCLEVGGQNGMGGQTVSRVVYTREGRWLDEGGFGGAMAQQGGGGVDRWPGVCTTRSFHAKLIEGTDVTERVNEALRAEH